MVLGYHVIISAYGFWLPNDERRSWSDFVGAWELLRFGKATKTDTRRSVAGEPFDWRKRDAARQALRYTPVVFTGRQANAVAQGFAAYIAKSGITVWACAILPEHVHMVVGRHAFKVESVCNQLKGYATRRLAERGLHPLASFSKPDGGAPTPWSRGQWKVFLDDAMHVRRAIRYVEQNPVKEGKPVQRWPFVTPCRL